MGRLRGGAPMPVVTAIPDAPLLDGYLEKLPSSTPTLGWLGWRKRWVALYRDRIVWSETPSSPVLGTLPLSPPVTVDGRGGGLQVHGADGRTLVLRGDVQRWAEAIQGLAGHEVAPDEETAEGEMTVLAQLDAELRAASVPQRTRRRARASCAPSKWGSGARRPAPQQARVPRAATTRRHAHPGCARVSA